MTKTIATLLYLLIAVPFIYYGGGFSMFKNMKIPVENNLDEIVVELERLGYKRRGWIGYLKVCFITTHDGYFTDHVISLVDCFFDMKITTLAELKEM